MVQIPMTNSQNPLSKYFRQPAIYIKLPSNGRFYPQGAIDMPANGELPVFPMTALDEINAKTPDALYNGAATANLIASCVPNIRDPWLIPTIDLDMLLVAIRIASYGHGLEISTKCPNCENENEFELDLRTVADQIRSPDYGELVDLGDLTVYFKPLNYQQLNENNKMQFEEQRILNIIPDTTVSEDEKMSMINTAFRKLTALSMNSVTNSIAAIKTQDGTVDDAMFISEYIANCDKKTFEKIREHIVNLKTQTELKPLTITCTNCSKQYEQAFTLDQTNFFE